MTFIVCVTPVAPVSVSVMGTGPQDGACSAPVTVVTGWSGAVAVSVNVEEPCVVHHHIDSKDESIALLVAGSDSMNG